MVKKILSILFALLLLQPALAHFKARYHVIVDTDGGIDDFRAICMMLASPEIEIIAITAVDGILPPEETVRRVHSLLRDFRHEGIPVGMGKSLPGKTGNPEKSAMAYSIQWAGKKSSSPVGSFPDATALILENIELEEMPVDVIALGPLTNLASVQRENPLISAQVRTIYWYNDPQDSNDFNYGSDPASAGTMLESGFKLNRISASGNQLEDLDGFMAGMDTIPSRYARAVKDLYATPAPGFMDHFMAKHLADDCVPLFLLYPDHFDSGTAGGQSLHRITHAKTDANLSPLLLAVLYSDQEDTNILLNRFPDDPSLFKEDVAQIVTEIIENHGMKEWRIVAITNEFHEHLGIYSILGAKMGLRAREYFNVGIDELEILTFAGSNPPVSCLNDGLQTSTGATLGHGTIMLKEGPVSPKARFSFKNRIIELQVRQDIRQQIKKDVGYGVQRYGLDSPEYWAYIRELALKYWLELDRFEIFDITEVPALPASP
jgi:pyrimidine-specific ribonucleoside hydrolase